MAITHRGAFDESAVTDLIVTNGSQITLYNVAGPSTAPANLLSGADDIFVVSSNAAPGTLTTRTAAQMYADLQTLIGVQNLSGFLYTIRITNTGAGTLTLAAGTGVTLGAGTYTVLTATYRDFVVNVVGPGAITITTTGLGTYS